MSAELDLFLNEAISEGYLASGVPAALVAKRTGIVNKRAGFGRIKKAGRSMPWSSGEDAALRSMLGYVDEEEIARHLGRTLTSIHLRWKRDLCIPAPSKTPGILTGRKVSDILGIEIHKICYLIDNELMPGRRMPGDRSIRLIDYSDLVRWCVNPEHWPYFDVNRLQDLHIRRLIELRRQRWNDDWWTSRQTADYHNIDVKDVTRYIKIGRLQGIQIMNFGGRRDTSQPQAWALWFVRRSDALNIKVYRGKGSAMRAGATPGGLSPAAREFISLARGCGIPYQVIAAMSGLSVKRVQSNIYLRRQRGETTPFVDWHTVAGRFPFIGRAVVRYIAGWPLSDDQVSLLRSILIAWADHHQVAIPGNRMPAMSVEILRVMEMKLNAAGVYPFGDPSKII